MLNPHISRTSRINAFLVDNMYDLELTIGQLRELEAKRDVGMGVLLDRLGEGSWRIDDVIETIRLGLIGGGMKNREAYDFVTRHIQSGDLKIFVDVAYKALANALVGDPLDKIDLESEGGDDERGEPMASTTQDD